MGGVFKVEWLFSCFGEPSESCSLHYWTTVLLLLDNSCMYEWVKYEQPTPSGHHTTTFWDIQGRVCVSVCVTLWCWLAPCLASWLQLQMGFVSLSLCKGLLNTPRGRGWGELCSRMEREERALQGNWNVTSSFCSPRWVMWHITHFEKSELSRDCTEITWGWWGEL